jgi:hypothetical protein
LLFLTHSAKSIMPPICTPVAIEFSSIPRAEQHVRHALMLTPA